MRKSRSTCFPHEPDAIRPEHMNFVAIDFETAKYSRESACSMGLVKFQNGKAVDTFYSLIRPPSLYIRPDFTEIHGLTVDDVRDAPKFADIWESDVRSFIGGFPLAAHNASFDMGVLLAVLDWYELDIPNLPYFCTCNLSRRTWPELKSHALTALAKKFNIHYNAHNALDDAMTCGKLVTMSAKKFGSANVAQLLSATGLKMGGLVK
ncbi:MAG: 3'-5' exonuclease [Betaproteobacteria bacterium]|nr:3'-5' exonuclease [Betaproteobacteria bacterium]